MRKCLAFIVLLLPILSIAQQFPVKEFFAVSSNTKLVLTYSGKVGVVQNDVLIIDTVYDALAAYDTVTNVVWAKRHLKTIFDDVNGLWGQIDKFGSWQLIGKGNVLITDSVFYAPANFVQNIAPASFNDSLSFFVNANGQIINTTSFDKVIRGFEKQYFVKKNSKWGILNSDLTILAAPQFDEITDFAGAYALASNDDTLFLIDKKGNIIRDASHYLNNHRLDIVDLCDTNAMCFNDGAYEMDEWIENYHLIYHFKNNPAQARMHNALILEKWRGNNLSFDNIYMSRLESYDPFVIADEKFIPSFEISAAAEYDNAMVELFYADSNFISYVTSYIHYLVENRSFPVLNISSPHYYNYLVKVDSLIAITINDILKPNSDKKLEAIFVKCFNQLDYKDDFETDALTLFSRCKNDVIISPLGLWFYAVCRDPELIESETFETVLIPFHYLLPILKDNSPISRFYKN